MCRGQDAELMWLARPLSGARAEVIRSPIAMFPPVADAFAGFGQRFGHDALGFVGQVFDGVHLEAGAAAGVVDVLVNVAEVVLFRADDLGLDAGPLEAEVKRLLGVGPAVVLARAIQPMFDPLSVE